MAWEGGLIAADTDGVGHSRQRAQLTQRPGGARTHELLVVWCEKGSGVH